MIIVAGEALIDLIVHEDGQLDAVMGGGPFNTARTIARLGGEVAFLGRLSADRFGTMLRGALAADGVDGRFAAGTDAPTTLAVAELDEHGTATYRFHLAETAAPGLTGDEVRAAVGTAPSALHVGTLGLVAEPMATAIAAGVASVGADTVVMADPNCRPRVILDRAEYLERLGGVLARADIAKVSADDLAYLAPDRSSAEAARGLLADGVGLVLLSDGARAVQVVSPTFALEVVVASVPVVDTVGAGDAFGGGFLARWVERGLGRGDLADPSLVRDAVEVAIEVAGLTCGRPGADPPRRAEVVSLAG